MARVDSLGAEGRIGPGRSARSPWVVGGALLLAMLVPIPRASAAGRGDPEPFFTVLAHGLEDVTVTDAKGRQCPCRDSLRGEIPGCSSGERLELGPDPSSKPPAGTSIAFSARAGQRYRIAGVLSRNTGFLGLEWWRGDCRGRQLVEFGEPVPGRPLAWQVTPRFSRRERTCSIEVTADFPPYEAPGRPGK